LKMEACAGFYDAKMEQRFAVMNEELSSVCSKHAVGKYPTVPPPAN